MATQVRRTLACNHACVGRRWSGRMCDRVSIHVRRLSVGPGDRDRRRSWGECRDCVLGHIKVSLRSSYPVAVDPGRSSTQRRRQVGRTPPHARRSAAAIGSRGRIPLAATETLRVTQRNSPSHVAFQRRCPAHNLVGTGILIFPIHDFHAAGTGNLECS